MSQPPNPYQPQPGQQYPQQGQPASGQPGYPQQGQPAQPNPQAGQPNPGYSAAQGDPNHSVEFLRIRQKITPLVNRYMIFLSDHEGSEHQMIAFAQQKRFAFKEQVTFYTDKDKTQEVFSFKARKRIDLAATYDVTDAFGQSLGLFRKQFKKSLIRSSWVLEPGNGMVIEGRERNAAIAVLRRMWGILPIIGDIPIPWLFHFDFHDQESTVVLNSTKIFGIRDIYNIHIPANHHGYRLDWRLASAMCVALDALQRR